ncbi:hypothetical protein ACTUVK_003477 [Stenotrophomonas rhizophila]
MKLQMSWILAAGFNLLLASPAWSYKCPDGSKDGISSVGLSTASTFSDENREAALPATIFMDRTGDLYPSASVPVDRNQFVSVGHDKFKAGRLKEYFRQIAARDKTILATLSRDAGMKDVAVSEFSDAFWEDYQAARRMQIGAEVQQLAAGAATQQPRPVVVLVHGYRNSYCDAQTWYRSLTERLRAIDPDVRVIELYWDGLAGGRFVTLWTRAQWNMPLVGVGLRRVINDIPTQIPLRFVGHSSGLPMLGSAFGDASQAFLKGCPSPREKRRPGDARSPEYGDTGLPDGCKPASAAFLQREGCYYYRVRGVACPRTAQFDKDTYRFSERHDLRLAGIAPAASPDTFYRYAPESRFPLSRIALATNPRDSATAKYGYGSLACKAFGSSCLSVMPELAFKTLSNAYGASNTTIAVWNFDKSDGTQTPRVFPYWTTRHSVEGWSQNSLFEPFLRFVLTDEIPAEGSHAVQIKLGG